MSVGREESTKPLKDVGLKKGRQRTRKQSNKQIKLYFCVGKVLGRKKNRAMELSGRDLL